MLDSEKSSSLFDLVWGLIADAFKYSNETKDIPSTMSLKDFFVKKLSDSELSETDSRLVMQMGEMWGAFVGSPWEKQSLKFFWLEECIDGGEFDHKVTRMTFSNRARKATLIIEA